MLIQNYGLFWLERNVFWGAGSNAGRLLGVPAKNVTAQPVDFREQSGVYVLYSDYQMIYVGQAGSGHQKLFDRIKQHRRDPLAGRWNQFSWFGVRWVKENGGLSAETENKSATHAAVLDHIEAILIHAAEPRHNRQAGRFGEKVEQYLQTRDDEFLGPTVEAMIRTMHDRGIRLEELVEDIWNVTPDN